MGKKSTPQAPAAPDPVATANAQSQANTKAAITQANLNRIDQVTPQGSLTYTQTGTNADGTPKYTQTQSYSPEQQALYDQQNKIAQALGGLAQQNIGRVQDAQSKPFSFDGMTPLQTTISAGPIQNQIKDAGPVQTSLNFGGQFNPGDYNQTAQTAADSAYKAAAARLDPQYAQQESDMRSRLAAQGISENSDAYRRELDNFARSKTDAYGQAQNNAFAQGLAAQNQGFNQALDTRQQNSGETVQAGNFANAAQGQIFGQNAQQLAAFNTAQNQGFNQSAAAGAFNNQARQQQIDEASYLRNLPLNDIAALLGTGGGVQNPNFSNFAQVGVAAPDYQGAVYANYNAANQQYQQQMQNRSQGLGSIFGLAGTLGAAAISDKRFKANIKRIGTLANGLATYVYNYIGDKAQQFGVMAQEALNIVPDAVGYTRNGVMYVNYAKVWNG